MENEVYPPLEEKLAKGDQIEDQKVQEAEESTVKFLPNGDKEDAKVQVEVGDEYTGFIGMGKEELQQYADDPFWVRLRWFLLILFGLAWIGMLAAAIAIVVVAPGCPPKPLKDWFHNGVTYQVYTRSFKDSDGDGNGDLKGISEKLSYLRDELNVDTLWLLSLYDFGHADFTFHVANHTSIAPIYGTMEDFSNLVTQAHEKGMKVIMDYIPNHSSNQHPWFAASVKKEEPYTNYYVWADGKTNPDGPPNDWLDSYGESAWKYDDTRGQYYYHAFAEEQPDLNLRDPNVKKELEDILKFWLDKGVDGFVIRGTAYLFESEDLSSNKTMYLDETYEIVQEWAKIIDGYGENDEENARFLINDCSGDHAATIKFLGYGTHSALYMGLTGKVDADCKANCIREKIAKGLEGLVLESKSSATPVPWMVGDMSNGRIASTKGAKYVSAINMLIGMLPGGSVTYYGEEVGMESKTDIPFSQTKDARALNNRATYKEVSRDPYRTPMQWNASTGAGFTSGEPWLPFGNLDINVEDQENETSSTLNIFKKVSPLRHSDEAFQSSAYKFYGNSDNILAFMRSPVWDEEEAEEDKQPSSYLVILNLGDTSEGNFDWLPEGGELVLDTNGNSGGQFNQTSIAPGDGVIVKYTGKEYLVDQPKDEEKSAK